MCIRKVNRVKNKTRLRAFFKESVMESNPPGIFLCMFLIFCKNDDCVLINCSYIKKCSQQSQTKSTLKRLERNVKKIPFKQQRTLNSTIDSMVVTFKYISHLFPVSSLLTFNISLFSWIYLCNFRRGRGLWGAISKLRWGNFLMQSV